MIDLRWLPIAAAALAGALFAGGVQQYRVMSVQRALSDARSEYMAQVTNAQAAQVLAQAEARRIEQDARARERELVSHAEQIEREARDAQIDRDRSAADAADVIAGLQSDLAAIASRAGSRGSDSTDTAAAGQCAPALDAVRLLTQLRAESASRALARARFADDAHAAGLTCEAAYAAARAATK